MHAYAIDEQNTTQEAETVNKKAADVAPGSVRIRGRVAVRGVAPTWEGRR